MMSHLRDSWGWYVVFGLMIGLMVTLGYRDTHSNSGALSRTDKIEAVYWHSEDRYSVAVLNKNKSLEMVYLRNASVFADLKPSEEMWFSCVWEMSLSDRTMNDSCEIHTTINDIKTAEYSCGKMCTNTAKKIN